MKNSEYLAPPPVNFEHEKVKVGKTTYNIRFIKSQMTIDPEESRDLEKFNPTMFITWGSVVVFLLLFWGYVVIWLSRKIS